MVQLLPLVPFLLPTARAADLGVPCTSPARPDETRAQVQVRDGVTAGAIAAADKPIAVGTFTVNGRSFTLKCKGSGAALRCQGVTEGLDPAPACTAASTESTTSMRMAAMNMEFLAVVPTSVFTHPHATGHEGDSW